MSSKTTEDCLDCVDGMALATNPIIGTCFRVCPACQPQCQCCDGRGRFPAWTRDMVVFMASLNDNGLLAVICHTCGGFLAAITYEEEPSCDN